MGQSIKKHINFQML